MSKIREILDKYIIKDPKDMCCVRLIHENNLDKLEKELQQLMTKAVNRQYKNALKKIKKEKA